MIRLSQIDENFSIYKENVVILVGLGNTTKNIVNLLRNQEIEIKYICDLKTNKMGDNIDEIFGIKIISIQQLIPIILEINSKDLGIGVVIQYAVNINPDNMEKMFSSCNVKKVVSYTEADIIFNFNYKKNVI